MNTAIPFNFINIELKARFKLASVNSAIVSPEFRIKDQTLNQVKLVELFH